MSSADRRSLGRKIRFEVFKRDSFTCRYCGAKAPDVLLECDHINPVAEGGDDNIMNLVTACQPCNSGKGARQLSDHSVLDKQRQQLEELNERRIQIEMMLDWRNDLLDIEKLKADKIEEIVRSKSARISPNESGRQNIEKWVKAHPFEEIVAAIDEAFRIYFKGDEDGNPAESWETAFSKVPGVIRVTRASKDKPYLPKLFYIRGILRRRLRYVNERQVMALLERAAVADIDLEHLERLCASQFTTWTHFEDCILEYLKSYEKQE